MRGIPKNLSENIQSQIDPARTHHPLLGNTDLFLGSANLFRHFGIKAHIGVDEESGLVHTVVTTAANVSDISQTSQLIHGQEKKVGADAGYVGVDKREEVKQALAANNQEVQWRIAKRRTSVQKMEDGWQKKLAQAYEKLKARIRARVEHPFHVIKNIFKHKKTRYRGLAKNDAQLQMLFGLSNLYMVRESLRP